VIAAVVLVLAVPPLVAWSLAGWTVQRRRRRAEAAAARAEAQRVAALREDVETTPEVRAAKAYGGWAPGANGDA
jgi:type II secretory pathway pseudopilin PulG